MKISKLLNKKNYIFFLFLIFFNISTANEPEDIWNIDKSKIKTNPENKNQLEISNDTDEDSISIYDLNNNKNNNNQTIVLEENNLQDKVSLFGIYDPDQII